MTADGHQELKVATSVGIVHLARQVLFDPQRGGHFLPANAVLPPHAGMVITRRLQEWACLLAGEVGFTVAQRLLGWRTGEPAVLGTSEVQRLVCRHGQVLREAAIREIAALEARPSLAGLTARLQPNEPPRCPAAWPRELAAVVDRALAARDPQAPAGVSRADWERVLETQRAAAGAVDRATLARLGPAIAAGQVVAAADEVQVRTPQKGVFTPLQTARVATTAGYRYLCGEESWFFRQLFLLIQLAGAPAGWVTFLADGGRRLRRFFTEQLQGLPRAEFVLDWYHLVKKVRDRISRMGASKAAKQELRQAVVGALWQGQVEAALTHLEQYRPTARNPVALDELQTYLQARDGLGGLPNYRDWRQQRRYIGSGWAEKANDLLVARRQKRRGMHWSLPTSEALALLKCLQLNHEWDAYWVEGRLPSLVAA